MQLKEQAGGYRDWEARGGRLVDLATPGSGDLTPAAEKPAAVKAKVATPEKTRKLSYKDQRELDALPALIESLEARQA